MIRINTVLVLILLSALSVFAQKQFSDPNVEYSFMYPEENWKMTVSPSAVSPNAEFVYNYKRQGHLEVRKLKLEEGALFGDLIKDEETSLQFLKSYVAGKEENFRGVYGGRVFNFEYVSSGRNMAGRYYFLKTDASTVWLLRFKGLKDNMRAIRPETDSIARTFKLN